MEQHILIKQVKAMLSKDYADDSIVYELKQQGINVEGIYGVLEIAKVEHYNEHCISIAKTNKIRYYAFVSLAVVTFLCFLIVLPNYDIGIGHVFLLSLIGSCSTAFFSFFAIAYYKAWNETFVQTTGRPNIELNSMLLMLLPVIILHFLFSWRFSSAQDSRLKDQQVEVIGRIIEGNSFQAKRIVGGGTVADFSEVIVEFITKEGQKIKVSKDISGYRFKDFHKDQQVRLVYSKENPRNIDFLTDEESIRKYKDTQERELEPNDLVRIVSLNKQQITDDLNKISFGWVYDAQGSTWSNPDRRCMITMNKDTLHMIAISEYNLSYPIKLDHMGFVRINADSPDDIWQTGEKVFQKGNLIFTVKAKIGQDDGYSVISLVRR